MSALARHRRGDDRAGNLALRRGRVATDARGVRQGHRAEGRAVRELDREEAESARQLNPASMGVGAKANIT